jgi:CheY-like chemotaxis protein
MQLINHIFLVDDDKMQNFLMGKFLEKTGLVAHTHTYLDGKAAYDALKELTTNDPDLPKVIFLDLNMPVWDGWVFLDEFQKLPHASEITVYILTSSTNQQDLEKAVTYGLGEHFFVKPLKLDMLKDVLLKHLPATTEGNATPAL